MSHPRLRFTVLLSGMLASACATGTAWQRAPQRVDTMLAGIERVHDEAARSRQTVQEAFERLVALAEGNPDKEAAAGAYARFVQSIAPAESQCRQLAGTVEPMQAGATAVFEQWQAEVATIGSEGLRRCSEARLTAAKERYQAIVTAAGRAQQQFASCVQALRDHATFLAHDLNADAITAMRGEVQQTAVAVQELDRGLEACQTAARAYVAAAALPDGTAAAAPAPR